MQDETLIALLPKTHGIDSVEFDSPRWRSVEGGTTPKYRWRFPSNGRRLEKAAPTNRTPEHWYPIEQIRCEDDEIEFRVQVCTVEHDYNASEIAVNELIAHGETIVAERAVRTAAGLLGDAVTISANGQFMRRMLSMRSGGCFVAVDGTSKTEGYSTHCGTILAVLGSFELLDVVSDPASEPIVSESLGKASFRRPASWQVSRDVAAGMETLELQADDKHDPLSRIRVRAVEKSKLQHAQSLAQQFVSDMSRQGLNFSGCPFLEIDKGDYRSRNIAMMAGRTKSAELIGVVLVHDCEESWISVELCSVARSDAASAWARNKRAFEIIRDSLGDSERLNEAHTVRHLLELQKESM